MYRGSGMLAKHLLRQIIWETLNWHRRGDRPDIALMGSRRSGSTLLMQVIAQNKGVKSIDQPFSVFVASAHQMKFLPWPAGGVFIDPDGNELAALHHYVESIVEGQLHVQEPWRIWRRDFHFRTDRCVFKTTDAHYIESLFQKSGFRIVRYFRHPIPQAISCMRNGWGDKLNYFAKVSGFLDGVLNSEQSNLYREIHASGNRLERYVLSWCCENMPLFNPSASVAPTVYYEELVGSNPGKLVEGLCDYCELESPLAMKQMLAQPSVSVKNLSEPLIVAAIKSGDQQKLIGRWLEKMTARDLQNIQAILDLFPNCPYRADAIQPMRNSKIATWEDSLLGYSSD